jgi:hypothetical protein
MITKLALKINPANPDHHLWNNHGTWWLHFTYHQADYTKQRRRRSLGTRDRAVARQRRDAVLAKLARQAALGLPFDFPNLAAEGEGIAA